MAEGKTTGFNARIMWKNKIKKWKTGDKGEKVQREKNRREEVKGEEAQREERQMGKGKGQMGKRKLPVLLAAVFLIALAGVAADLICQRETLTLPAEEKGTFAVSEESMVFDGFQKTEEGWTLSAGSEGGKGELTINADGAFVGRLCFSYQYEGRLEADWYVWYEGEEEPEKIEDSNSYLIGTSVERLDGEIDRIRIEWTLEKDSPELTIMDVYRINAYSPNWHRMFFVWVILFLAVFLWCGRRWLADRLEAAYLVTALSAGLLMIVLLPANKVSWDEEVHFFHTYCVSYFGTEVRSNEILEKLFVADEENWPYSLPANLDERREMNETLNTRVAEEPCDTSRGHALAGIYTPAYISQALGLRLGLLLGLPFTLAYQLGRLGNLLFCALIMAWAIRRIPVGKAVLAVIGLMPTPLFLMATYSYDAFISALFFLGFASFLDEYMHRERKISWPAFALIALCFAIGSMPKAIYVPLILIVFLLPQEKFGDRRQEALMKGMAVLLFLALMASFVLPTVLSPAESNDLRGGNTSEAGQIPYILSDIPGFLQMLISSIRISLPGFTIGAAVYGSVGHLGQELFGTIIPLFVLAVLFADEKRLAQTADQTGGMNGGQKDRSSLPDRFAGRLTWPARAWILLLCAAVMAMVWVAMYLAFTPVGSDHINGVQARYYIPLLPVLYLCLCPDSLKISIGRDKLYPLALTGAAAITIAVAARTMLTLCG